jgi:hypothetical protein
MSFTVTLSSVTTGAVTRRVRDGGGTATDPEDYAGPSGTLSFPAGATTRTIAVPIVGDTLDDPTRPSP